jgi:iron(III) transport system substrate-binding protein
MPSRRWREKLEIEDGGLNKVDGRSQSSIIHPSSSKNIGDKSMFTAVAALAACLAIIFAALPLQAQSVEQLIAGAKKEGEVTLVASASTFGGKKGFAELEAGFNKRFGLKHKVNLAPGPSFPQVAARILTELKSGAKSSSDLYLGSDGTMSDMSRDKALQKVNWSGAFPWVTKEMEILPQETLLVYASFHGIIYNSNAIPKDKAPKSYEDLVDPALSPTWAGKIAIPAYIHWLVRVSGTWGKEKVLSFARKLAPLAGGRLRQGEEERIVSGEFPIMASTGGALEAMWKWQAKGAPLVGLAGSSPATSSYYQLAVPRNSAHPDSAKLFVAFMSTREAQAVIEKYDWRSSYLVDGTLMAKYVKANKIKLQDPGELNEIFMKDDAAFEAELTKILLK